MTRRFGLSGKAEWDLEEIWDYTAARWGVDQAELYIRQLVAALEALASTPDVGRPCDDILPGYRKHPVGSHVVFYKPRPDRIDVVRILRQWMDVSRHL